jgi:hypothetical protein
MQYDRVSFSTATTGTGTVTAGSATSGFRAMATAASGSPIPDGTQVQYTIEDGAAWETGTGVTGGTATTLTRVLSQSSTGALLNLSGSAKVYLTAIASRYNTIVELESIADPAVPPANILLLYAKKIAGKVLPKFIGPSGIDTILQTGFSGNSIAVVSASSGATTPSVIGITLTNSGTLSATITIASANRWQATFKKLFTSAGAAASTGGTRQNYVQFFRGNAAGFGGFFFRAQFGQGANVNGAQCFFGLCASTALLATSAGAVGALVNMIGMGYDTTDASTGNWFIFRNDGAGSAVKVDLGTGAARNTNDGYDLILYCPPGAATDIFVRVVNIHTGTVVLDTSYNTDLPAVNTGLCFKAEMNNGAIASAVIPQIAKVYIESDY